MIFNDTTVFYCMTLLARILQGLGLSMTTTISIAYLPIMFPNSFQNKIGYLESIGSLGFFLGPLMASLLYSLDGHYLPFLVLGILSTIIFVILIFKLPKDK